MPKSTSRLKWRQHRHRHCQYRRLVISQEPTNLDGRHALDDAAENGNGPLSGYLAPKLVNSHAGGVRVKNM